MAFEATARVALVLTYVTGTRTSALRKLVSRKSGFITSCSNQARPSGVWGLTPAGGCLLEWQRAQFCAKTSFPRLRVFSSALRYFALPGALASLSGFA